MNRRSFIKFGLGCAAGLIFFGLPELKRPPFPPAQGSPYCRPLEERGLKLVAVGDIMAHLPVTNSALQADGSYDFRPCFQYLRPLFRGADLVMGNLETPLAGGRPEGYPTFNAPDELAEALSWAGFTALSVANNHSLDQGWAGLERTVKELQRRRLIPLGAAATEAEAARPRLFEAAGLAVGLTAYTYGVNFGSYRYPRGESWRLNFVKPEAMAADLAALKKAGADFSVVNVHFGQEYQRRPNREQLALVDFLFEAGADLVIGHHPHVAQPALARAGAAGEKAAVFSLGNFISNQRDRYTDQGLMISLNLGFDRRGRKSLAGLTVEQTRCVKRWLDGRRVYRVLPSLRALEEPQAYGLTETEYQLLAADQLAMSAHLVNYEP